MRSVPKVFLAVFLYPHLVFAPPLRAQVPSECIDNWRTQHDDFEATRGGPADLMPGSGDIELKTVSLALEEEKTLRFKARVGGLLAVRNAGRNRFDAHLLLRVSSDGAGDRLLSLGTLEKGTAVVVPVIAGNYELRLSESGELEEFECPPLPYHAAVTLSPPDASAVSALEERWESRKEIKATPGLMTLRTTLAALNPEPVFVLTLDRPSLVEVALPEGDPSRAQLSLNGVPKGTLLQTLQPWTVHFSVDRAQGLPLDRLDIVNLRIKTVPLQGGQIIQSVPNKATVEVLGRVVVKLVLRNQAPLDFRNVSLKFVPYFTGASTPPGMQAVRTDMGRLAWVKTFDSWESGEEKAVDFGVLIPRVTQVQSYSLGIYVTTLEMESGSISDVSGHFLREEIALVDTAKMSSPGSSRAVEQADIVEHPDYETRVKIPVMRACGKKHPRYDQAFQRCQDVIFHWRNRCAASHRVTTTPFVDCVWKGIESEAPDLLRHE
jgi:hypothetical protein